VTQPPRGRKDGRGLECSAGQLSKPLAALTNLFHTKNVSFYWQFCAASTEARKKVSVHAD
jgi:hypothetical protein